MTSAAKSKVMPTEPGSANAPTAERFLARHSEDVLASLGDGLVLLDLAGQVAFVSPRAEDLTGVSAALAVARRAEQAFTLNPWIAETLHRLRNGAVGRTSEAGELLAPFGRRVAVQLIAAPVVDALGAVVGTLLLFRDMTAQRSLGDVSE